MIFEFIGIIESYPVTVQLLGRPVGREPRVKSQESRAKTKRGERSKK